MYREEVDEWPIGHTPPEVKERYHAALKRQEELEGATSDSDSSDDNRKDGPGSGKGAAPGQRHSLPTPPHSAGRPLPIHGRKRRIAGTRREEREVRGRKTETTSCIRVRRGGTCTENLAAPSQVERATGLLARR